MARFNVAAKEFNPNKEIKEDLEWEHRNPDYVYVPPQHAHRYYGPPPPYWGPPPPSHWGPPPPSHWGPPQPPPYSGNKPLYWGPPPSSTQPLKVELLEESEEIVPVVHTPATRPVLKAEKLGAVQKKAVKEDEPDSEPRLDPGEELLVVQKKIVDVPKVKTKSEKCKCINCSRCVNRIKYDAPSNYNTEEKLLWKKISPPKELERISPYLCEGEPVEMALIREAMINHKFKLNKFQISDDEYYISSEKTKETSPDMITFQLHYYKYHIVPYKFTIRGENIMHKTYEYDPKTFKIISKIHITTHLKGPRKIYKMTYDYDNKKKTLEVSEYDTHIVIHTEEVTGECWFENDFKYR